MYLQPRFLKNCQDNCFVNKIQFSSSLWLILEFILLKCKWWSQCKWREKRILLTVHERDTLDMVKERSYSSFSHLAVCREKTSWHTLFIHNVCSSLLWTNVHFKRKSRMLWVGRVGQRKVWRISDSYVDLESLEVQIERLQLCRNT